MSDLVERAVAVMHSLPPERQEELAHLVLFHAEMSVVQLTAEEEADMAESLAQADRGEFPSNEEVRAVWAKYGL